MEVTLTTIMLVVGLHFAVLVGLYLLVKSKFKVRKKYVCPSPNGAVVITGASSGIGFACAVHLANQGHTVYAGFRSLTDDRIAKLKAETKGKDKIVPVVIDVTIPETIAAAAEKVRTETQDQGIVGLVNSAGLNVGPYPLEYVDPNLLTRQLDVNVVGQVRVVQAFLPSIRAGNGRIVFMSSVAGKISGNFQGPYAASKFAIEALADSLRRELTPWNISVSVIIAGEIETPLLSSYNDEATKAKAKLQEISEQAVHYYGTFYDNYKPTKAKFVGKVEQTNRAIAHSLHSPAPKTRYTVASRAMMAGHLYPSILLGFPSWSVLPDRFLDKQMYRSQWPRRLKPGN